MAAYWACVLLHSLISTNSFILDSQEYVLWPSSSQEYAGAFQGFYGHSSPFTVIKLVGLAIFCPSCYLRSYHVNTHHCCLKMLPEERFLPPGISQSGQRLPFRSDKHNNDSSSGMKIKGTPAPFYFLWEVECAGMRAVFSSPAEG